VNSLAGSPLDIQCKIWVPKQSQFHRWHIRTLFIV